VRTQRICADLSVDCEHIRCGQMCVVSLLPSHLFELSVDVCIGCGIKRVVERVELSVDMCIGQVVSACVYHVCIGRVNKS